MLSRNPPARPLRAALAACALVAAGGAHAQYAIHDSGARRAFRVVDPAAAEIVLHEEGRPGVRRVLTRRVLVRAVAGFDARAAAAAVGGTFQAPPHAPGHFVFNVPAAMDSLRLLPALRAKAGVLDAEPLLAKRHTKRLIPNDPFFSYNAANPGYQWHLRNTGQNSATAGIDVNVAGVWDSFKGAGVRIGIVDDGLEVAHPDLAPNADTANDHDWNDATPDDPTGNPTIDNHGTACAGVAAARGSNGAGVSGAAMHATLVGLRLIAGDVDDLDESQALSWRSDIISIYSNSWGPDDDAADLVGPGPLTLAAFAAGTATGRGGKGSIFVWAGGNGGEVGDNANYDGYANSIHTIAVGAVNDDGTRAAYSERGANLVVSAPSDDSTGIHQGITTTTTQGGYEHDFGGTSSACPLVAGVIALLLEARPGLGWRDVREILIRSARKIAPTNTNWDTNPAVTGIQDNGAGFHFNHDFGAGIIDAAAAVAMAQTWVNLGPQITAQAAAGTLPVTIPNNNATGITRTITIPAATALRVEHATLHVTATHPRRGDLAVTLTSPAGTASTLCLAHGDTNANLDWTFSSVRNWGENAAGNWTVKVADTVSGNSGGSLTGLTLTLHGSNNTPYALWVAANFPATAQQSDPLISGPAADPDGDARNNAAEYSFGGNPLAHDGPAPLVVQPAGAEAHFIYTHDTAKTDLTLTPQLADSPAGAWSNATSELVATAGTIETRRVRVLLSAGQKFFRLRATVGP